MSTLQKDAKVRVTNIAGTTDDSITEPHFQLIGAEGYVREVLDTEWLYVILPTHRYYSKGNGAYLRTNEVELV